VNSSEGVTRKAMKVNRAHNFESEVIRNYIKEFGVL
jgi:hypothetical protein